MKSFFLDADGKPSMGRLISTALFLVCTGMWIIIKVSGKELTVNDTSLIQMGWIASITGKAVQKFAERS